MKINVARSAGFCFGVKRAIDIAVKTAKQGKKIETLGDIVHNEDVAKEISLLGIKKVNSLKKCKDKILLIRAHGIPKKTIAYAKSLGYKIVDATCPMVHEIHRIAKNSESNGRDVIVIGDRKHDEVLGIIGQLKNKALVIDPKEKIPLGKIKRIKQACVVSQSTQNFETVLTIIETLKQYIKDLKFSNTICLPTRMKQAEIKTMPLKNDIMIIVGSKASANTKRLYEISKSRNNRSYWIQSKKDIKRGWFKDVKFVGITAGASTSDRTTQDVIGCIKKIT